MNSESNRLIVVSNRLPFVLKRDKKGEWQLHQGSGGLVSAMVPVLRNRGGMWIGWPGMTEEVDDLGDILDRATADAGYELVPVLLNQEEHDAYYYGYSNEVIWPLFHDLPGHCHFDPEYLSSYRSVNNRFAKVIQRHTRPDDFIWIHDYQLMYVAHYLRTDFQRGNTGFFLHIPFPSIDILTKLPKPKALLQALLQHDTIGFQTHRDRRNFVQCIRQLTDDVHIRQQRGLHLIRIEERDVRIGTFPIGIDFADFESRASDEEVGRRAWNIHAGLPECTIMLGVDRLDYTKGVQCRLEAFRYLLRRHPELHRKIIFTQILVPSRMDIPKYRSLKVEIDRMVGEINGEFTHGGWVPVHYIFSSLDQQELLAYYRTAEIGLITPLKDGMNLVAKEYCACNLESTGVLILSQFAGAAAQLCRGALLVNPYDIEGVAEAIHTALELSYEDRYARMQKLRRNIRNQNVFWWMDSFLKIAFSKRLDDFPRQNVDEYYFSESSSADHVELC